MKAYLTFNLPDDRKAFLAAAKAGDMANAIWDIVYNTSKGIMRHYEGMDDKEYDKLTPMDGVQMFRERVSEILDENGINIDDLTE